MLNIIKNLLTQIISDIDEGNSNINTDDLLKIIKFILSMANLKMSKIQAADYLGVSRATFDNYIKNGWIPKGEKLEGFKELSWNKSDLDIYKATYVTK